VFEFFLYRAGARKECKMYFYFDEKPRLSYGLKRAVVVIFLAVLLLGAVLVRCARGAEIVGPREVVMASFEEVKAIYTNHPGAEEGADQVREAVFVVLGKYIDAEETAKRALGPPWKGQSVESRTEFVRLFKIICFDNYSLRLGRFFAEGDGEIVKMDEQTDGGCSRVSATVRSRGEDFQLKFSLKKEDIGWKVYDLSAEGIGLVNNYRSQFSSLLGSGKSFADLLELLRSKVGEPFLLKPAQPSPTPASWEKEVKKKKRRKGKDEETVLV
jgi:phospholipid transport system substrate-binding protein